MTGVLCFIAGAIVATSAAIGAAIGVLLYLTDREPGDTIAEVVRHIAMPDKRGAALEPPDDDAFELEERFRRAEEEGKDLAEKEIL